MANYRVAKRYAKAFMEILPAEKVEGAVDEMKQLLELLNESNDLLVFMRSPIISNDKKKSVCQSVFSSFSEEFKNLIALLIKNGRGSDIKEVALAVMNLYRNANGIKKVIITSAQPLTEEQTQKIVAQVKENFSTEIREIEVENKINPELIGGFILRIDDQQFDASLRTKINRIKQEFDTNHYISKI